MTDIACVNGVDLLMDYMEHEVSAQVRAMLEAHVAGCPRCAAFIASYRATPRVLRRATSRPLPAAAKDALWSRLRSRAKR